MARMRAHMSWLLGQDRGQAQRGCLQGFFCSSHFGGGYVCIGVDGGALCVPPEWCGCSQSRDLNYAFNCIKIKTRSTLNSESPQATKVM